MNEREIRKVLIGATLTIKYGKPYERPYSHVLVSEDTYKLDKVKREGKGANARFNVECGGLRPIIRWQLKELIRLVEKGIYVSNGDTYIFTPPADPASSTSPAETSPAETSTAETSTAETSPAPTKPTPRRTKRQGLQNLIDGIVNNEPPTATSPSPVEATASAPSTEPLPMPEADTEPVRESPHYADLKGLDLTTEQLAKLLALRTKNAGRPKGALTGEAKKRPDRATFVVPRELTQKLKLIALYEGRLYKDVVADALTLYTSYYEEVHGVIPIKF